MLHTTYIYYIRLYNDKARVLNIEWKFHTCYPWILHITKTCIKFVYNWVVSIVLYKYTFFIRSQLNLWIFWDPNISRIYPYYRHIYCVCVTPRRCKNCYISHLLKIDRFIQNLQVYLSVVFLLYIREKISRFWSHFTEIYMNKSFYNIRFTQYASHLR